MNETPAWKDITTFSRGDKERTPRTYEIILGAVVLTVTRWIHGDPGRWYLDCSLLVGRRELQSIDIEGAKREAMLLLKALLQTSLSEVESQL